MTRLETPPAPSFVPDPPVQPTKPRDGRLAWLEPLRGLAALWVFSYHHDFSDALRAAYPHLHQFTRAGYLGVPMFFVISGYCIASSAYGSLASGETVGSFLRRRARRIYPPYWCSLLVVVLVPFAIEALSAVKTGVYQPPVAGDVSHGFVRYGFLDWVGVVTLARVFAFVPGADSLQYKFTSINAVYWTLAIEVQFYAVVAVAMWFGRRLTTALLVVTTVALVVSAFPSQRLELSGVFLPYWPTFAVGVLLYLVLSGGHTPVVVFGRAVRVVSATAVATVAGLLLVPIMWGHPPATLLFAAALGVMLWANEGLGVPTRGPMAIRPLMVLGAMSYSVYLIHGRVQHLAAQAARQVMSMNTIPGDVAVFSLTLAGCYVFYWTCERPFATRRTRPWAAAVPAPVPVPAEPGHSR